MAGTDISESDIFKSQEILGVLAFFRQGSVLRN